MKYTVEIHDENGIINHRSDCSKREAINLAKAWVKQSENEDKNVFVTFFRKSDGQHGYLNRDGNHGITGKAW